MGTKNNPGRFDCYANAELDEPMFILLGRDPTASIIVAAWCDLRTALGHPEDFRKIEDAAECADALRAWANKLGKEQKIARSHQVWREMLATIPELADEWKDASGLMAGGDPGGVTPATLREHQGMVSDVVGAAESFVYAACHDQDAAFSELKEKLEAYLKRWPEQ